MNASTTRPMVALALLCWLVLRPDPVLACSCVPQTVAQAKQDAAAIFEGRVTSIVAAPANGPYSSPEKEVTLSLARSWRGTTTKPTITVRTAESGATCGYIFALDESYLVYASGTSDELFVNSCGRTRLVSEASEDLAVLGPGATPRASNESKSGAVTKTRASSCAGSVSNANRACLFPFASSLGLVLVRSIRKRAR